MPRSRFCFICPNYLNTPFGGIDRITVNNARALAARGHEVHVVVTQCRQSADRRDGEVYVHERPLREFRVLGRWFPGLGLSQRLSRELGKLHRAHPFDVVEIPNWEGLGLVPAFFGKLPVAIRHHTSMEDSLHAQQRQISWKSKFVFWMERTSARFAAVNVVHSEHHRLKLAKSMPDATTAMIRHALPGLPSNDGGHPSTTIPGAGPTLLSVGALTPRKGIDTLLEAARHALPKLDGWTLVLVGHDRGGHFERKWHEESPEAVRPLVRFAGFLDDQALLQEYRSCEIYVTASVFESFGLTCVEAMRLAKPVVACRAGALPELVDHGRTGLLVPPGDAAALGTALLDLAQDENLRRKMGSAASIQARAWLDMAPICDAYEQLTESVRSRGHTRSS